MTLGLPYIAKRPGIWRNPLAFPTGRASGFDPNHLASPGGVGMSAIAVGSGVVSLLNGSAASVSGAPPTYKIYGDIGYTANVTASTSVISLATTGKTATFAAIASIISATGNNTAVSGTTQSLYMSATSGQFVVWVGNNNNLSGFTPTVNNPYFVVASFNAATINWVIVNLRTGAVFTASNAVVGNAPAASTSGFFGNVTGGAQPLNGNIAAGMLGNAYIPQDELLAWGADPWSFWYPDPLKFEYKGATALSGHFLNTLGVGR